MEALDTAVIDTVAGIDCTQEGQLVSIVNATTNIALHVEGRGLVTSLAGFERLLQEGEMHLRSAGD